MSFIFNLNGNCTFIYNFENKTVLYFSIVHRIIKIHKIKINSLIVKYSCKLEIVSYIFLNVNLFCKGKNLKTTQLFNSTLSF